MTRIVMFLLQKAELGLLRGPRPVLTLRDLARHGTILFVAADTDLTTADVVAIDCFERVLRAEIERQYNRQGLSPVTYDLQVSVQLACWSR